MTTLLQRFRAHVEAARLFPKPGAAVAAVSGGPDSVALLDLLHEAAGGLGLSLVVAHADHGIRPDSRAVAASVGRLAERYGLPLELGELGLGPGATETVARRARYAWLREVQRRRAARYVVTAHHADDLIETVLMRVLGGSGPAGLAGIPARGRGGLVRPLLPFTRAELAAHAAARALPTHADPANADPRHLRSWIRVELLPLVERRLGAAAAARLRRLARLAARDRRAWDAALQLVPELDLRVAAGRLDVARRVLAGYDEPLSVALVRAAARRVGLPLGYRGAARLLALAESASGRRVELGAGWWGEAAFERLVVARGAACAADEVVATAERGSAAFGEYLLRWAPEAAPERLERAGWTTWVAAPGWEVRRGRAGDRVAPLGGTGHRPLRRLLMEARVPRGARGRYPVVARGETILWVPGICRSGTELPAPGTRAVRLDVTEYGEPQADRRP